MGNPIRHDRSLRHRREVLSVLGSGLVAIGCAAPGWGREKKGVGHMATDLTGGLPIEREYVMAERPAQPEIRDAVNVWIEEENGLFGMRIGVEATSPKWESHETYLDIAFPDGRVISRRSNDKAHPAIDQDGRPTIRGAGPLRFQCVEPFRRWTVSFKGQAPEITAADLIKTPYPEERLMRDVEFYIDMRMAVPPWVPGALLPEARAALGGDQGQFVSPRYEQLFRAEGEVRVADKLHRFKGQGLRIRRQGFRKFEGFWGHCWQSGLFPSGKAFGYNIFPPRPDGTPSYAEGFVFDGEGALQPARPAVVPWMDRLLISGDDVPLELETENNRIRIEGKSFINLRGRYSTTLPPDFPADFPIIQQSHVRYRWGDEQATGMMERSTPPSKMKL
jgi:hypothetical protein